MKSYVLKPFLLAVSLILTVTVAQAQFDDVYYDPDFHDPEIKYSFDDNASKNPEGDVIYYDDDSYAYYDDYDYYYSSRIRRFYRPYAGFGFYDPIYVGYNYYDPFAWDYYAYPGSNIYFSFGIGFNFGWGSAWYAPAPYYYGYNGWYYPSYTYWNGCGGYYPYGNYYNPYCPPHGGGYYGGGWGSGYYPGYGDHHHGGHGDYYYGPRTTGNTGSSPRGPQTPPGIVRTDPKSQDNGVTDSNDRPGGLPTPGTPGRINPSGNPVAEGPVPTPERPTGVKQDPASGEVRQIPVDREIPRDQTPTGPKRPVFKPDADRYQPYPTPSRPATTPAPQGTDTDKPRPTSPQDRPANTPITDYKPYPQAQPRDDVRPSGNDKPSTPPSGYRQEDRPRYTPPPRPNDNRNEDRPGYTPPSRNTDESRSNDRPSYSPPPRHESSRSNNSPSHSPSSPDRSSSPSGGSNRSSGSSGSSHSSSPRGRG